MGRSTKDIGVGEGTDIVCFSRTNKKKKDAGNGSFGVLV